MANEPDRDYSENIEKKFRALELRVEQDVVRRLRKAKEITSTADWQLNRYYVLGNSTRDIENIFKETVGDTYPEVFELYDKVLSQQYVRTAALYEQINEEAVPYDQNPEMRQLVDGLVRTSNDQLQNITGSMGFMLDYGSGRMVFTPLAEIYDRYLDDAILDVASGAFDYGAVLRRVTRQLTNSGLRTIDYPTGHTNRCDVAARRAIMTGIAQLTGTITEQNAAKLGTKYYEVEWHAGARPTHMVWQGKVYHEDDLRRECGLGDPLGLCGINCYHRYYPFIPGVSVRSYTDEWLAEMNEKELTPHAYRGKEYTRYEAEQRQRYLETCIRAQRERVSLLKTGDADPDDVVIQQCRYQAMLDEYRKFSKAMGLPTQAERIYTGHTTGRIAPTPKVYAKYRAEQANKGLRVAKSTTKADNRSRLSDGGQSVFNTDKYDMPESKIRDFLLKPGAKHAKEFFDVGYTEHDTEKLNADIHEQFNESKAIDKKTLSDGSERFCIIMELGTEKKKTFRTVWQKDKGVEKARFITSHREGKTNV